uniref:non-specific serine/threonine protein kinase n=1 Tax=Marmota marmota marmota TaxID=9994 RepID=A0A8C5YW03_MARMA
MKAVEHPSVVQLFQVMETADRVYLVMEYAGWGQLLQYIPEGGGPVASALRTCHAQGIAHRDVKAENILLDARGRIKLCDFGLGCQFRQGELLDTVCGTVTYWAPEMFLQQAYIGPAVDVWSLGVVLYLMLTGHLPFEGDTFEELRDQVLHRSWVLPNVDSRPTMESEDSIQIHSVCVGKSITAAAPQKKTPTWRLRTFSSYFPVFSLARKVPVVVNSPAGANFKSRWQKTLVPVRTNSWAPD